MTYVSWCNRLTVVECTTCCSWRVVKDRPFAEAARASAPPGPSAPPGALGDGAGEAKHQAGRHPACVPLPPAGGTTILMGIIEARLAYRGFSDICWSGPVTCLPHLNRVAVVSAAAGIPTSRTGTTGAVLSAHSAWTVRATGRLPGRSAASSTSWWIPAADAEQVSIWQLFWVFVWSRRARMESSTPIL